MKYQGVTTVKGRKIALTITGNFPEVEGLKKLAVSTIGLRLANYVDEYGMLPSVGEMLGSVDSFIIIKNRFFKSATHESVKTVIEVEMNP